MEDKVDGVNTELVGVSAGTVGLNDKTVGVNLLIEALTGVKMTTKAELIKVAQLTQAAEGIRSTAITEKLGYVQRTTEPYLKY